MVRPASYGRMLDRYDERLKGVLLSVDGYDTRFDDLYRQFVIRLDDPTLDGARFSQTVGLREKLLTSTASFDEIETAFRAFLTTDRYVAVDATADAPYFWSGFLVTFRAYEQRLDVIDAHASRMLASAEAFCAADIASLERETRQIVSLLFPLHRYATQQTAALLKRPEIAWVKGLAEFVMRFHGLSPDIIVDDLKSGPPPPHLRQDLAIFQRDLGRHRDLFSAIENIFVDRPPVIPHTYVVLPREREPIETPKPVVLIEIAFELIRAASQEGYPGRPNQVELFWNSERRRLRFRELSGSLNRALHQSPFQDRLERLALDLGPWEGIRWLNDEAKNVVEIGVPPREVVSAGGGGGGVGHAAPVGRAPSLDSMPMMSSSLPRLAVALPLASGIAFATPLF